MSESATPARILAQINNVQGGGLIVAIDGPSGVGKSTAGRHIANHAEARYLDTGAMYRVATLWALEHGVNPQDASNSVEVIQQIAQLTESLPLQVNHDPLSTEVLLDGRDVSHDIRGGLVTRHVSAVAAISQVRQNLVSLQRSLALNARRCIVDGRDIGRVVLPESAAKIMLVAAAEVRAQRRYDQDKAAGREGNYENILADIIRRDEADAQQSQAAEDAIIVDSSSLTLDEVIQGLSEIIIQSAQKPAYFPDFS